jgi:hypothetical protein
MDIGDIGLARQLVEKDADQHRDIDREHQPPGVFPQTQIHSAPEAKSGANYHTTEVWRATRDYIRRRPCERGTHTP